MGMGREDRGCGCAPWYLAPVVVVVLLLFSCTRLVAGKLCVAWAVDSV